MPNPQGISDMFSNDRLKSIAMRTNHGDDSGDTSTVVPKKKSSMLIPNLVMGAASGLDGYTTNRVLSHNGEKSATGTIHTHEANPFMSSNPGLNAVEKGLSTAGMMYLTNHLAKKDSKGAKLASYALSAIPAMAGISNIRQLHKIEGYKNGK